MELRHIKVDYNEAVEGKRNILSAELSSLELIKKIKSYRFLRKEENNVKNRLKKELSSIREVFSALDSNMPKEVKDIQKEEQVKIIERNKDKKINPKDNLKNELEEIKRKLESLNK